jgi:hypothetical protein
MLIPWPCYRWVVTCPLLCLLCLQALALEFGERADASHDGSQVAADNNSNNNYSDSTFYEITIATVDQPKLLSRLSDAMVSMWCKRAVCRSAGRSGACRCCCGSGCSSNCTGWFDAHSSAGSCCSTEAAAGGDSCCVPHVYPCIEHLYRTASSSRLQHGVQWLLSLHSCRMLATPLAAVSLILSCAGPAAAAGRVTWASTFVRLTCLTPQTASRWMCS